MLWKTMKVINLLHRYFISVLGKRFHWADIDWVDMDETSKSDENFVSLLQYWSKSGDRTLKIHLGTRSWTAMYVTRVVQNEIIVLFGEIIQWDVDKVKNSGFWSVLTCETTDNVKEQ